MIFEEMNKHIANAGILVGKSKRTEPKNVRKPRMVFGIINKEKVKAFQSFTIYRFRGKETRGEIREH